MSRGPSSKGPAGPARGGEGRGPQRERSGKPARTLAGLRRDENRDRSEARGERRDRPEARGERHDRTEARGERRERTEARGERRGPGERSERFPAERAARTERPTHSEFHERESETVEGAGRAPAKTGRESRWSQERRLPREGEWYISGLNGVREALRSPNVKVRKLYVGSPAALAQLSLPSGDHGIVIEKTNDRDTKYGPLTQGVAVLVSEPNWPDPETLIDRLEAEGRRPLLVALDQVEDPMNLGQILRTCEGSGVDGVIVLKHRSTHLNQTVAQVSQGAFAWMPVLEVVNLRQTLDLLKHRGLWVVGCEGSEGAQPWHRCRLSDPLVLVFGAEGSGLRTLTRKTCDVLASLPMQGHMESLNVGAAVSAFVYETARQRLLPSS